MNFLISILVLTAIQPVAIAAQKIKLENSAGKSMAQLMITKEKALQIALKKEHFLGTWVTFSLKNQNWHISSTSKSMKPPLYMIIEGTSGAIVYHNNNIRPEDIPAEYKNFEATEVHHLQYDAKSKPLWDK